MPFLASIQEHLEEFETGSANRVILDYLLANARGRLNAKPWQAIANELDRHNIHLRQQSFQQGLLKRSREGQMYLGSNDHGPSKGYYIIIEKEDAELTAAWYRNRIAAEQNRLEHLERLIHQAWPTNP